MEPSELRKELLRQHADLRALAGTLGHLAERTQHDASSILELLELLDALHEGVGRHNAFEERELHAILPTLDAWGKIREGLMDQRHEAEHEAVRAAIKDARSGVDFEIIAAGTLVALQELFAHMDREEKEVLHPEVLRDDLITSGVGG